MLATKLNLSEDEAERWIVNLIRNARLDAKIDAKEVPLLYMYHVTPSVIESHDHCDIITQGHVIMMSQPQSIYQRVIDKTKGLAFQAQFLAQSIDKRLNAQPKPVPVQPVC